MPNFVLTESLSLERQPLHGLRRLYFNDDEANTSQEAEPACGSWLAAVAQCYVFLLSLSSQLGLPPDIISATLGDLGVEAVLESRTPDNIAADDATPTEGFRLKRERGSGYAVEISVKGYANGLCRVTLVFNSPDVFRCQKSHTVNQSSFLHPYKALAENLRRPPPPANWASNPGASPIKKNALHRTNLGGQQQRPPVHCAEGLVFAINVVVGPNNFAAFQALTKAGKVAIPSAAQSHTLHTQTTAAPRKCTRTTPRPACPSKTSLPLPLRMNGGSSSPPPHSSPSSQLTGARARPAHARRILHPQAPCRGTSSCTRAWGPDLCGADEAVPVREQGWARRGRGGGRDAAGAWADACPPHSRYPEFESDHHEHEKKMELRPGKFLRASPAPTSMPRMH
ncbi:hypothetical protein GGX14DRAFT_653513 [Mycena pura]|uniref:Uncharacterized protein n=1 Tax=Mycena pura TaxID=153505 RepID=A0AAD6V8R9_9AGAR|nr:hypothetical protein GGX14DRAFT_402519 [Mycena pura]KAJ7202922.1 hypothetical protein GGX14DRAFT_653513 [Mycena pura]